MMEPNTCFPRGTENLLREPDGMELVQALLWKNETARNCSAHYQLRSYRRSRLIWEDDYGSKNPGCF